MTARRRTMTVHNTTRAPIFLPDHGTIDPGQSAKAPITPDVRELLAAGVLVTQDPIPDPADDPETPKES